MKFSNQIANILPRCHPERSEGSCTLPRCHPNERVKLRNIISGLAKDRVVILSTHIVSDIETTADSLMMLKNHKVMYMGAPGKLTEKLRGKVYEIPIGQPLPEGVVHLSERTGEDGAVVRFAITGGSSLEKTENAKPVTAGLEDAFLYLYRD